MGQTCLSLLCLVPLRSLVLLKVPALISPEWVTAHLMHSSKGSEILSPLARGFADFDNHVKIIGEAVGAVMSALSLHAYARLKHMQLRPLEAPVRQALGMYLERAMAPQPLGPLGPMARGLLTTTRTQDADFIPTQAQRMKILLHFLV